MDVSDLQHVNDEKLKSVVSELASCITYHENYEYKKNAER